MFYDATVHNDYAINIDMIQAVSMEYAYILEKDFDVAYCPKARCPIVANREKVYIKLWQYPEGDRDARFVTGPADVSGIKLDSSQRDGWLGWNADSDLRLIANDKFLGRDCPLLAALFDTTVFVPFNMTGLYAYTQEDRVETIYRKILDWVALNFVTKEVFEARQKEYVEFLKSNSAHYYVKICTERIKAALAQKDKDRKNFQINMETAQKNYIDAARSLERTEDDIRTLLAAKPNDQRALAEFEKIKLFPHVKEVSVYGKAINVTTDELQTQKLKDGTIRSLGAYQIAISLNSGGIRIKNLTRLIDANQDHPHVRDQKPCLGNIGPSISKLVARYEIATVVEVLLKYLQTINESDTYGKTVTRWPVKETI